MFAASKTASVSGGYQISRSLRFNSADTAYLARTPSTASNRRTYTWSGWVKKNTDSSDRRIFEAGASSSNVFWMGFGPAGSTDQFIVQDYSGGFQIQLASTAVYRDPSAWYHVVVAVDTTQATSTDRVKIYINGVQITSFVSGNATFPSQNYETRVNQSVVHDIGGSSVIGGSAYFNGYMTEVYFIDGQALTPSSFGETNAQTGVWQPKAYSGSYGTNGFYLNFSDNSNTTAATLGKDYSGNGNNWTPNNFSVTAGAGNDSVVDSPTSYGVDTGVGGTVRGNYATLNPLSNTSGTVTGNGNLQLLSNASHFSVTSTIGVTSGKWYSEVFVSTFNALGIGVTTLNTFASGYPGGITGLWWVYDNGASNAGNNQTTQNWNSSPIFTAGMTLQIVLDADSGKCWIGYNNTFLNSTGGTTGNPSAGTNPTFTISTTSPILLFLEQNTSDLYLNAGQRPFAYTAPSGYKALCTQNLPTPTIGATTATLANKYFDISLWTGNSSYPRAVSTGLSFQPDFAWVKGRNTATLQHVLQNSVQGAGTGSAMYSDQTSAQGALDTYGYVSAFNSDGISVNKSGTFGENVNYTGWTYVAWQWKANGSGSTNTSGTITSTVSANTTSGFSIVTYTGQSGAGTVGHGLGVAPSMIIVKSRSNGAYGWAVWHSTFTQSEYLLMETTDVKGTASNYWNSSAPSTWTSAFGVGAGPKYVNNSGDTFVAYCFAQIAGYSAFGSYTGNGSTDGAFIYTGFRPAYVMIKRTDTSGEWVLKDTTRSPYNADGNTLLANRSDAEYGSGNTSIDELSNGFKCRTTSASANASGGTYVYMAFASNPFKYSLAR